MRKMDGMVIGIVLMGLVLVSFILGSTQTTLAEALSSEPIELTEEEMEQRPLIKVEVEPLNDEEVILISEEMVVEEFIPVDVPLSAEYQKRLFKDAESLNVDPYIFIALMESESATFDPDAKGDWKEDGYGNQYYTSYGMTQIRNCWWDEFKEKGLDIFNNPYDQIIGGLLIYKLYEADTVTQTLMNYKCGPYKASSLIEQGIVLSSVTDIINRAEELRSESIRDDKRVYKDRVS